MTHRLLPLLLLPLGACGYGLELWGVDTGGDGFPTTLDDTGLSGGDGGSLVDGGADGGGGDAGGGDAGGGDAGGGDGGFGGDGGGTGGDGGGGSGDGGSGGGSSPPSLTSVSAAEVGSRIEVSFELTDTDGDIEGGYLWMSVNGTASTYNIPAQISDWRPSGTSRQYVTFDDCDRGSRFDFQLQAFDAAGHSSATRSDSVVLSGSAITISELGDDGTYQTVSSLTRGSVLCGDMHSTGLTGSTYTGDLDFVRFKPSTSGSYHFTLDWDTTGAEYELALFDSAWNVVNYDESGGPPTREFDQALSSSSWYIVRIAGSSGPGGPYTLTMD